MVDWDKISKHQALSEDFIRYHVDNVNWLHIFKYQLISEGFKQEFSGVRDIYFDNINNLDF